MDAPAPFLLFPEDYRGLPSYHDPDDDLWFAVAPFRFDGRPHGISRPGAPAGDPGFNQLALKMLAGLRIRRSSRSRAPGKPPALPSAIVSLVLRLEVVAGDITTLAVDAIANAANNRLWMGAGVAGAIKRAGGEEIEREALAQGPIDVGDAVATGAGSLPARYVIHGAVMGQDLRTSGELIERTTCRCLELADELGCESLALPAFGTGVGGFPLAECARLMVGAARGYEPRTLARVVFAVFGPEAEQVFRSAL